MTRCSGLRSLAPALLLAAAGCGSPQQRRVAAAAADFRTGCDRGEARACASLGALMAEGAGVRRDERRAFRTLVDACREGDALARVNLAAMYARSPRVVRDDELAHRVFEDACDDGMPLACANLGALLAAGRGAPADGERALELFRRSCALGSMAGCFDQAAQLELSPGQERGALALHERACDAGYGLSCLRLGAVAERGLLGAPRDLPAAMDRYGQACDLGKEEGCLELGELLFDRRRPDLALRLYRTTCQGGGEEACRRLAAPLHGREARPAEHAPQAFPTTPTTGELGWLEAGVGDCVLAGAEARLQACYGRSAAAREGRRVEGRLRVEVHAGGAARLVEAPGVADAGLAACLAEAVRGLRFPRAREASAAALPLERAVVLPRPPRRDARDLVITDR